MEYVLHILWPRWNYKGVLLAISHTRPTHSHQSVAVSSDTAQVVLRAKRGHFDYSSGMTYFTQSSPHSGLRMKCWLWSREPSRWPCGIAICHRHSSTFPFTLYRWHVHSEMNPEVLVSFVFVLNPFESWHWEYTNQPHQLQIGSSHIK